MTTISSCDTEPTVPGAALDESKENHELRHRQRHVRLNYPAPLVHLAVNLQRRVGVRRTAGLLGLQLSTLYRWIGRHDATYPRTPARCSDLGVPFDVTAFLRSPEVAVSTQKNFRHGAIRAGERLPMLQEADSAPDRTRDKIMAVKALLDQRFAEPWTCGRLAGCCGLSRLHFIHMFARYVGVPPYQYLTRVRVERARELSMEPNQPLRTIAREVGFGSTSSLHRAFHRYLGASPGELFNCAG
jgi:AraC-like DNA-binding protein